MNKYKPSYGLKILKSFLVTIIFKGYLNSIQALVQIDPGAINSFISEEFYWWK